MDQSNNLARSQELYQQGNQFYQSKNYQEAINCYSTALQHDPQNYKALFCKGNILKEMQNYNEVIKCYDEALQYAPNEASIYFNKGNTLITQGKFNEALQCYEIAIKNNPKEKKFYINKGNILRAINRNEEAIQCYDKAIEFSPQDPLSLSNKGIVLFALNRIKEAIKCYDLAIQKNPNFALAHTHKGIALIEQNKKDQALECFNVAIQNNIEQVQQLEQSVYNLASFKNQNKAYVSKDIIEEERKLTEEIESLQEVSTKIKENFIQSQQQRQISGYLQINNQIQDLKIQRDQVKKCSQISNQEFILQKLAYLEDENQQLKRQIQEMQSQVNQKVDIDQIQLLALKVRKEIKDNVDLKNYNDALHNQLYLAVHEAEIISSTGKLQLNQENHYVQALTLALSYIPLVGNLVSSGTKGV